MLFVPLPFVVGLLLLVLFGRLVAAGEERFRNRLFLALLLICAGASFLIGIRWGYGIAAVLPLQSLLGAILAPVAWLSYSSHSRSLALKHDWPHLIPVVGVAALMAVRPELIDIALIATYATYGAFVLWLLRRGPDALTRARFESAPIVRRSMAVTAGGLLLFAFVDLLISIDFRLGDGSNAAMIVTVANLPALLVVGLAAAWASPVARDAGGKLPSDAGGSSEEDLRAALAEIESLFEAKQPFLDADLSLSRLARISRMPMRRISEAVNRLTGQNVSQYVNAHRIKHACAALADTDDTILAILLRSGFTTKSNFNREFRRCTGLSPSQWRKRAYSQG